MNTSLLTQLGLSEKGAKVYLATLALGTASVQDIARRAGLKRPTTYLHIEELLQTGLLHTMPLGKKDYYQAADPEKLEQRARQRLEEIQTALPELQALKTTAAGRPNVRVFEGANGLALVYDEICQANSIRFWSNLATFEKVLGPYFTKISSAIRKNSITTREIITNSPEAIRSARSYAAAAGRTYTARIAAGQAIQNDNALYGDVVALFRIQAHNLYVVRIEDPVLASSLQTIFDMAWESAKILKL